MSRRRLPDIRLRAQIAKRKHRTESKDQRLHHNPEDERLGVCCQPTTSVGHLCDDTSDAGSCQRCKPARTVAAALGCPQRRGRTGGSLRIPPVGYETSTWESTMPRVHPYTTTIRWNRPLSLTLSPLRGARESADRLVAVSRCALPGSFLLFLGAFRPMVRAEWHGGKVRAVVQSCRRV